MEMLVQIKKIAGKKINPAIFSLKEVSLWADLGTFDRAVLKTRKINDEYIFAVKGVTYVARPWKVLNTSEKTYYADVEWTSVLELLVGSPLI